MDEPSKIDPFAIVGRRRVLVRYGELEGATARIFRLGENAVIRISNAIVQEGRLRFSVAHEMGHLLLGHVLPVEAEVGGAWFNKRQEREADAFASEHLMPEEWVRPFCSGNFLSVESVRAIARVFRSSVMASALRFAELSSEACAVVYSENGKVAWAKRSSSFPARIPKHLMVPNGTLARDYHDHGLVAITQRVSSARSWLGRRARVQDDDMITEEAEVVLDACRSASDSGWSGVLSLLRFSRG